MKKEVVNGCFYEEKYEEKTADEMFEEIGYTKKIETIENGRLTLTEYKNRDKYSIIFKHTTKETILDGFRGIELQELQAINKKVQELGWKG